MVHFQDLCEKIHHVSYRLLWRLSFTYPQFFLPCIFISLRWWPRFPFNICSPCKAPQAFMSLLSLLSHDIHFGSHNLLSVCGELDAFLFNMTVCPFTLRFLFWHMWARVGGKNLFREQIPKQCHYLYSAFRGWGWGDLWHGDANAGFLMPFDKEGSSYFQNWQDNSVVQGD